MSVKNVARSIQLFISPCSSPVVVPLALLLPLHLLRLREPRRGLRSWPTCSQTAFRPTPVDRCLVRPIEAFNLTGSQATSNRSWHMLGLAVIVCLSEFNRTLGDKREMENRMM